MFTSNVAALLLGSVVLFGWSVWVYYALTRLGRRWTLSVIACVFYAAYLSALWRNFLPGFWEGFAVFLVAYSILAYFGRALGLRLQKKRLLQN